MGSPGSMQLPEPASDREGGSSWALPPVPAPPIPRRQPPQHQRSSCSLSKACQLVVFLEKLHRSRHSAEMRKQREFYHKLGMEVPGDIKGETCSAKQHLDSHRNGETKADDSSNKEAAEEKPEEDNDYHRSDEQVSICLECNSSKLRGLKRKWIRCSAQATVLHLKKFIAKKLNLSSFNELDILCNEEILGKDHTLKFVVVTRWRFKKAPLLLHYRPKMDLL
ncbi:polycomb group RING finger protein 3 isoform X2 [Saimiri boliviensis]|uniref:polycomb group RING finger protein 3 isoform X2 n=1 Tax=Saimiri boliviensis TaxID=27679 RepID=UPI003D77A864